MKLNKFLFLASLAAVALVSCDGPVTPGPGPGPGPKGDDTIEVITIDTTKAISLDAAIAKAGSGETVVIKGYVNFAYDAKTENDKIQQSAWIAENPTDKSGKIQAYWCTVDVPVSKGDYVAVQGQVITFVKSENDTTYEIDHGVMQFIRGGEGVKPIVVGDLEGDGSLEKPYTAADVIALNSTVAGPAYVKGYIVGQVKAGGMNMNSDLELVAPFTGNTSGQGTNIIIAAAAGETNAANMVPVQLPSGLRAFSLPADASVLGKEIIIYGKLQAYFGQAGIKEISYAIVDGKEYGAKPVAITDNVKLNETLLTKTSFDKFTVVNVLGDLTWVYSVDAQSKVVYGAKMSGYDDKQAKTFANEDWFISPAFDATGGAKLTFDHARGPKASLSVPTSNYTVWVSNDFSGDVKTATWTQITIPTHGTTAWSYVNSGEMAIPEANCAANCRIAWKYVCNDTESATWEIKNVIVQ